MKFTYKILNADNEPLAAASGENELYMVYHGEYKAGDRIVLEAEKNHFAVVQLDDAMGEELIFLKEGSISYEIPFNEKRVCYSPKCFLGERHLLTVRDAAEEEISAYRNLARNRYDQHGDTGCYPHAAANVETRGEAVFAARNAIDGIKANDCHGEWPYGSWGINRNPEAVIRVDFGRQVLADKLVIYLRADFPHDNWWKQITVRFSDGTVMSRPLIKTGRAQTIELGEKRMEWIQLEQLIQSEEPSPFPALTQLEVYGREGSACQTRTGEEELL